MIYLCHPDDRLAICTSKVPLTPQLVGNMLCEGNEEGWKLVTCQQIRLDNQVMQLFYLADDTLPVNDRMTRVLRGIGDDDIVHGNVVVLTRGDMLSPEDIDAFNENAWGHA